MSAERIEFIDLKTQQRKLKRGLNAAIRAVLEHGHYIMGPEVAELERQLCAFTGAKHCVSCANGTDALMLALMAIGTRTGDAVFCPSFTFVATAEAAALLGATPVFTDVEPEHFTMDLHSLAAAVDIAKSRGLRPKAVIPVDLFGHPADYPAVNRLAAEHGMTVIADAAQSFGSELEGRKTGTLAAITTTSFFPAKPLGCYGDGGAVFTDDDTLAEILRSLRIHGKGRDKYDNVRIGVNGRLDTLQAAILIQKLTLFPAELEARNRVASRYSRLLKKKVTVPRVRRGATSAWAQYTIQASGRDQIAQALSTARIPSAIYYPIPLHRQGAYRDCPAAPGGLPVSERLARTVLSLPMHPYLQRPVQQRIAEAVLASVENAA